jgi:hypothetical protein
MVETPFFIALRKFLLSPRMLTAKPDFIQPQPRLLWPFQAMR